MGNIKVRALKFVYVMAVNMAIIYMNFQLNPWVSLNVMVKLA